jgi:hypothetical protein
MSTILLSKDEQGVVIFHVWKSLAYQVRLALSLFLITIGFVIQYYSLSIIPGILFVFAGNLLLLVKGYDSRIKLGTYKPDAEWVKTDKEQLARIIELNNKAKKWDISAFDITSGLGVLFFILSLGALLIIYNSEIFTSDSIASIVAFNIAVLLYPHWFTGVRRITTTPKLVNKIQLFQNLLKAIEKSIPTETIEYLIYVKGKDTKFPDDVKLKLMFKDQPKDFLGMYAQVSLNNVQGKDYPYFYVVLVAKDGFGMLDKYYNSVITGANIIKEKSTESGVEIIVIRQYTTKTSGYHTNFQAMQNIIFDGLRSGRDVAGGK